ncbi:hypothetical protein Scep_025586 [Stephania cephalantha]|uniref:Uncharacterized protein n=1 Tax=Stephania cephalantha TaxID=152367 RepID=A0AAP0ELT3_9MAGN
MRAPAREQPRQLTAGYGWLLAVQRRANEETDAHGSSQMCGQAAAARRGGALIAATAGGSTSEGLAGLRHNGTDQLRGCCGGPARCGGAYQRLHRGGQCGGSDESNVVTVAVPDFKDSIAVEHPIATVTPFGMSSRFAAQVSRQCRTD